MKILYKLLHFLPHKFCFFLCGLLLTAEMAASLLTPFVMKTLITHQSAFPYLIMIAVCPLFIIPSSFIQNLLYRQSLTELRRTLGKHHLSTYPAIPPGELLPLLADDCEKALIFLQGFSAASLFRAILYIVSGFIVLLSFGPLALLFWAPISFGLAALNVLLARQRGKSLSAQRQITAELSAFTHQAIRAREEIIAFQQESAFDRDFSSLSARLLQCRRRQNFFENVSNALTMLADFAALPLAFLLLLSFMDAPDALVTAGYAAVLLRGFLSLTMFWNNMQIVLVSGHKLSFLWKDEYD